MEAVLLRAAPCPGRDQSYPVSSHLISRTSTLLEKLGRWAETVMTVIMMDGYNAIETVYM